MEKKQRTTIWLSQNVMNELDQMSERADCRSRSEFIEKAIRYYAGYLSAEKNKVVLGEQIQKVVESSVKSSEGRLSNQSFRMAVELAKLQRIIAYYFQMDEETLSELHNLCQREVKSMNGTLSLEDMIK